MPRMTEITKSSHKRGDPSDRPTIRAGALIIRDGSLLLVRQQRDGQSYWLLPGGGVRFGESLGDALKRELWEELRLRVVPGRPLALAEAISTDMAEYPKHVVHVIVAAHVAGGSDRPRLGDDQAVLEAGYHTPEALQELNVRPPIVDFLRACISGLPDDMVYLGRHW